ncbi:hypothetical protein ACJ41O_014517 [Fusarium nematophilum]
MHLETLVGFALSCLVLSTAAQDVTCWGVDGKQWSNNKQCPGSSACCGENATCMPNRLCKNKGQADNEFVRGPCRVAPYDKKECASICIYEETDGRFPRVKLCSDGSYCCDNDAGCCSAGRGTFLDAEGNVLDGPSATSSSEASETSTAAAETTESAASKASTESTASAASTGSDEPSSEPSASSDTAQEAEDRKSDSGDDSQSLKIGLGVAIPATAIIAALAAWFFFRRKQARTPRTKEEEAQASGYAPDHEPNYSSNSTYYSEVPATEHRRDRSPQELPS